MANKKTYNTNFEVTSDFLAQTKRHLRVFHQLDDELITQAIIVSVRHIWTQLLLLDIADLETKSTDELDVEVQQAVMHATAMIRSNPDERIESSHQVIDNRLTRRILGSKRDYF